MQGVQSQTERAYDQVVEWLEHFQEIEDPRQSGKVAYPLEEMLLQCLLAVLAGADSWVEIAEFGKKKLDFLRRFLTFEHGTPSHDQFGNLFAALDADAFQNCFIAWVTSLTKLGPDVIVTDWQAEEGRARVSEALSQFDACDALESITVELVSDSMAKVHARWRYGCFTLAAARILDECCECDIAGSCTVTHSEDRLMPAMTEEEMDARCAEIEAGR